MSLVAASLLAGLVIGAPAIAMERFLGESFEEKKALFGELHLHTGWSFDAYIFGVRSSPDDAYRFARGETYTDAFGQTCESTGTGTLRNFS